MSIATSTCFCGRMRTTHSVRHASCNFNKDGAAFGWRMKIASRLTKLRAILRAGHAVVSCRVVGVLHW